MSTRVAMLTSAVIVGAGFQVGTAAAQAQEIQVHATETTLGEVVVTARKREESLLDVPVVATVISQETLEQANISDLAELATRVPGLVLGGTPGSLGPQVAMRGVGPTSLTPTNDQSVSLNVDGVPLSQGWAYTIGVFDVAQVEVLKGPQSLYFGKNNTAGVISLRSADPTDKAELTARIGYENEAKEKLGEFVISGPVSESFKLRLAARYSDQDGYFKNEALATPGLGGLTPAFKNYAPTKDGIVRGTVLFRPNDSFTARLKLNYESFKMDAGATPQQAAYCPEGTGAVPPVNIAFIAGDDCKADKVLRLVWFNPANFSGILNNGKPFQDMSQTIDSLELSFHLSQVLNLTSVTGYSNLDTFDQNLGAATGTTVPLAAQINFRDREVTEELRLTSNYVDRPVNFMLGAFYQDAQQSNQLRLPGNSALGLAAVLQEVRHEVAIRSTSFFAQLMWNIKPELELSGGARWTDETRDHTEYNYNPPQGPIGPVFRPDPHLSASNVSPEVTLTYKPTHTLTAFAAYRTGFKSGSFSTANFQPSTLLSSFKDEKADGGEVGVKTETVDHKLAANIAVYQYNYEDLQVGANELSAIGGGNFVSVNRTLNAASAVVRGVEFDVRYSPAAINGLALTAAANYNHARYDSFPNAPCGNGQTISQGCNQLFNPTTGRYTAQDLSGRRLVRAPDWTGYAGFDQKILLGNNMTVAFGGGVNYSSEYSTTLPDLPGFAQPSYYKVDANVALRGKDERWEVALIGRNLGDESTSAMCTNSNLQNGAVFGGQVAGAALPGPAGGDEAACTVERGREIWARLSWKFL
jgi:iron complex outermembrane recepter protein